MPTWLSYWDLRVWMVMKVKETCLECIRRILVLHDFGGHQVHVSHPNKVVGLKPIAKQLPSKLEIYNVSSGLMLC